MLTPETQELVTEFVVRWRPPGMDRDSTANAMELMASQLATIVEAECAQRGRTAIDPVPIDVMNNGQEKS